MQNRFENWHGRIIWSADNVGWNYLYEMLSRPDFPRDEVAVKLDRLFLTKYGLDKIEEVQDLGIPVFADAKIVEIPSKTMDLVKLHLEHHPWMLNVMAQVANTGVSPGAQGAEIANEESLDMLNDFATECKSAGTLPCVVTVLTSKTPELVKYEYGGFDVNAAVLGYVSLAANCGVTDIVCSPKEAEFMRGRTGAWTDSVRFNTPGVRLADSSKDDQKRVMTPGEALAKGANRLVIGRDLGRDGDFVGNLQKIMMDVHKWETE